MMKLPPSSELSGSPNVTAVVAEAVALVPIVVAVPIVPWVVVLVAVGGKGPSSVPGSPAVEPSPPARLRCNIDVDPRRATLFLTATGTDDPTALVTMRLSRFERGEDDATVERQREVLRRDRLQALRSALPLARQLSATGPHPSDQPGWQTRPVAALTGEAELSVSWEGRTFGPHLQPGAAIHLVPPVPPEGGK